MDEKEQEEKWKLKEAEEDKQPQQNPVAYRSLNDQEMNTLMKNTRPAPAAEGGSDPRSKVEKSSEDKKESESKDRKIGQGRPPKAEEQ